MRAREENVERSVIVTDERGNEYEATYPKRARGLVKKGRARYIGENKICLTETPLTAEETEYKTADGALLSAYNAEITEDDMSEYTDIKESVQDAECENEAPAEKTFAEQIFEQIMNLRAEDEAFTYRALNILAEIPPAQGPGDVAGEARGNAINALIDAHKAESFRVFAFYEKLYEDARKGDSTKTMIVSKLMDKIDTYDDNVLSQLAEVIDSLRHIDN